LFGLALILFTSLLSFPQPLITRYIVDDVILARQLGLLATAVLLFILVVLVEKLMSLLEEFYFARFEQRITLDIQHDLAERTLRFPKSFFDKNQTGYLMSRLSLDVEGLRWFFSSTIVYVVSNTVRFLGGLGLLFYLEWRLAVVVLLLLPGIVLMAFFVGGLFSVSGAILFSRDLKILRRYWVTPLRVPQYLAGFALGYLAMCVLQFTLLVLVGRVGFGATVTFAQPLAVLYLVLAAITFLAFGFLIASLAKTAQSGMAIANLVNMPIMFLSGLFFPVADLPLFLRVILYLNPLSYLAEGLRFSLGTGQVTLPLPLTFLVPLGWTGFSAAVAARRLRWDVAR